MKFVAVLQGKTIHVELKKENDVYVCNIDGRDYVVDAMKLGPLAYSMLVDGKSHEIALEKNDTHFNAHFYDHYLEFQLTEARKFKAAGLAKKVAGSGLIKVVSPMPGKIVKVTVTENAIVQEGEPMVVMEAMKMQNEFRAPRAGTVRQVAVKVGDTVQAQQLMVVVE